ncbi:MAG: 16S rRNA processing protein RimM [Bacteroidales bacterium]|nr:16S rRNA processing protein RimM [Bacteroidales bacterium]MBQ8644912.1 16S rRNA processing protein RimM [Bacteroidales bacterium]MBR1949282.1 16S rRNA processing protein RimM [Bacteroidales bacterium]MBR4088484.1 16S rRNA processing protein RimM [Bacteroidales bacterium]
MLRPTADMDLLPVAQIVKSYDVNGEVVIRLSSGILEDYNFKKEPVFIIFDGLPVPFFITSFKTKGSNGALVKFETINDLSHSEELLKKEILVDSSTIDPDSIDMDEDQAMAAFLMGFKVKDQNGKLVGEISDYYNYPNNPCIELNGKHLVPFNEELILKLDNKKRVIAMTIPGGLLED